MPEKGRLWIAFKRLAETALPQIDYCAIYPGTIVAQNGQTFDFLPDSAKVPGIKGIDLQVGIPGVTFTLDTGSSPRAELFFEGHSPSSPKLGLTGFPGLQTLSIGQGGPAAARVGDTVALTLADLLQFTWPVSGGSAVPTGPVSVPSPTTAIKTGSTITTIA